MYVWFKRYGGFAGPGRKGAPEYTLTPTKNSKEAIS